MDQDQRKHGLQLAADHLCLQTKIGSAAQILQTVQDSYYLAVMDRPKELGKIIPRVMDGHFFTGHDAFSRASGMLNQLKASGLNVMLFQQVSTETVPYTTGVTEDEPK